MAIALDTNNKTALMLLLKYCFYRSWYNVILINFDPQVNGNLYYPSDSAIILSDISATIFDTLKYLKLWAAGSDITDIDIEDLTLIRAFNPGVQDRGVTIVVRKLFSHVNDLQILKDNENCPRSEKLIRHIQRCVLLIDLWYAGEDLTYFGAMLDTP